MRECYYCKSEVKPYAEHILIGKEKDVACVDCFEDYTLTSYYVGGEFVGTDEGEITHVYSFEDEPELKDEE